MSMIAKDISNTERSVKCDTDGTLLVSPAINATITVNIIPSTSIVSNNSIVTIAGSAQTTLLDYTNTTGGLVLFDGLVAGGTVDAEYEIQVNGTKRLVMRSSEQNRDIKVFLPAPMRLENNDSITVKVTHYKTYTADFDSSLFAHRS